MNPSLDPEYLRMAEGDRGRLARRPSEISWRGWWDVLWRVNQLHDTTEGEIKPMGDRGAVSPVSWTSRSDAVDDACALARDAMVPGVPSRPRQMPRAARRSLRHAILYIAFHGRAERIASDSIAELPVNAPATNLHAAMPAFAAIAA